MTRDIHDDDPEATQDDYEVSERDWLGLVLLLFRINSLKLGVS